MPQFDQSHSAPPAHDRAMQVMVGAAWVAILGTFGYVTFGLMPRMKTAEDRNAKQEDRLVKLENAAAGGEDVSKAVTVDTVDQLVSTRVKALLGDSVRREVDEQLARRKPAGGTTPAPQPTVINAASVPVGTVLAYAGEVTDERRRSLLPDDWMPCDGRPLRSADYKSLYGAIGEVYGDGSQDNDGRAIEKARGMDFNLPDYRGLFLRGVTGDRKDAFADTDVYLRTPPVTARAQPSLLGSNQADSMKGHDHSKAGMAFLMHNQQKAEGFKVKADPQGNQGPFVTLNALPREGAGENRPRNTFVYFIIKVK